MIHLFCASPCPQTEHIPTSAYNSRAQLPAPPLQVVEMDGGGPMLWQATKPPPLPYL